MGEKGLYGWVAPRHAPTIEAKQDRFFVHAANTVGAAWKDVEVKEKRTARQLLQPEGCSERGSLGRQYLDCAK